VLVVSVLVLGFVHSIGMDDLRAVPMPLVWGGCSAIGVVITPLMSVLSSIRDSGDWKDVLLTYGNRTDVG